MQQSQLDELRQKIDQLDDTIIELLGERFQLISQVSQVKKDSGAAVHQPGREAEILKRVVDKGRELGLNPLLLQALFLQIFAVSKKNQV